jgi:type VI secretion system protein ImpA
MSALNIDKLLAPIAEDKPTGDDLEYDAQFMELERVAQGTPERVMGDSVQPAEDPDWGDVQSRAEELFGRTKDLRVAVHLARAALARHGAPGLADGLRLIERLLNRYWDAVHPKLDPEDDNDPTMRMNCLLPLTATTLPIGFVAALRVTPIVSSPGVGRFSYRDYLIATGELQSAAQAEPPPDVALIEAAFKDADVGALTESHAALDAAFAVVAAIKSAFAERVSDSPDLDLLQRTVRDIRGWVAERLSQRGVGAATSEPGAAEGVAPRGARGEIASREDVVAALERVCDYYQRYEPSSPIPLLLRRAQRLARMDFMEILRDMTPGGVAEAELITGVKANPQ